MNRIHILNGDALADRFPDAIDGDRIVARECLCDGPVSDRDGMEFWAVRANFMASAYGIPVTEYMEQTPHEFNRILDASPPVEWYLWFEDDLFCQVNMWFVSALICRREASATAFLVRPEVHTRYGFAGVHASNLRGLLHRRLELTPEVLSGLAACWQSYRRSDVDGLVSKLKAMLPEHPWLATSLKAVCGLPGEPKAILNRIRQANPSASFPSILDQFSAQAPEYGFGDLQVKRLLDQDSRMRSSM